MSVNASQRGFAPPQLSFCLAIVVAFATLAGCTPKRIPGTEIDDTDETRAIIAVMDKYRHAMEAKDAEAIASLASESFEDDAGTGSPSDDLDYKALRQVLPQRFARIEELRLELTVKKITIGEDEKLAQAIYYYTTSFRMPGLSNKPKSEAGLKMMTLKKVDGQWKMLSGI